MPEIVPTIYGTVDEGGRLHANDPEKLKAVLRGLTGQAVQLTVERRKDPRTLNQNAWYWACVVGIPAEHFGYSKEEFHEIYKAKFLRKYAQHEAIGFLPYSGSTSNLTKEAFTEYVEKCRQWCAENEIVIPDPGEVNIEQ